MEKSSHTRPIPRIASNFSKRGNSFGEDVIAASGTALREDAITINTRVL